MGKVTYGMNVSLDGYIEDSNGSIAVRGRLQTTCTGTGMNKPRRRPRPCTGAGSTR